MNKILLMFLLSMCICAYPVFAADWQQSKSEHFIVFFNPSDTASGSQGLGADFAKKVLDKAEECYTNLAEDLGYPRYSEFWTWDKRVKIYIYNDHASYISASGQPEWSHGMADYTNKQILSYSFSEGFLDSILPHETAHLIFRDFVGLSNSIPLWLDEGIAQWAELSSRQRFKDMVRQLYLKDALLSLNDMMRIDIRKINKKDRIYIRPVTTKKGQMGVVFLDSETLVNTYYIESFSLVGFMIEKYGSTAFASFCRQLRDGKTVEASLKDAYPNHIRSIEEFEDNWRKYLEES